MTNSGSEQPTAQGTTWTRRCREAARSDADLQLWIHTRSAAPAYGTRTYVSRVRERAAALREKGQVSTVEHDVWGRHLEPGRAEPGSDRAARLAAYQAWADRRDATLPVEERSCDAMLIEDSYTVLVPPHVLVGVVEDGEVLGVAPCHQEGEPISVMDLLTVLGDRSAEDEPRAFASA